MSYQQGYPQQQPQPQGAWQGGGYPAPAAADNGGGSGPAVAIIAAILGLAAAGALVVINVDFLGDLEGTSLGDLPGELMTIVIQRFAATAVLLIGVILVFARKLAGAFIVTFGGLMGIVAILLYPVLLSDIVPGIDFGTYFESLFKFNHPQATFGAIALIASPLALIFSILPPTLSYLRGPAAAEPYGGYPQQPQQPQQQGW